MLKILITICARGGSKGIPGKNIKVINEKPLIAYSIDHALELKNKINADIGLSTDSSEIIDTAAKYGLRTDYKRNPILATDCAGKIPTLNDLILFEENKNKTRYDYIIDIDVTSPLRKVEDIRKALEIINNDEKALNIFSVSQAKKNPYYNIVEKKSNGYYSFVKESEDLLSRQKAPKVYDINASFYIYRRRYFELGLKNALSTNTLIFEQKHMSFDLDDPIDFLFLEYLLKNNQLDFKL